MPLRLSRRSKYGAVKTTVDGLKFDSKAEARRYQELKMLSLAKEIRALVTHPRFPLLVSQERIVVGHYEADFTYHKASGELVVEDVKGGPITALARWKLKHFEAQYGFPVTIVRMR
jgi:hypothetical protein